MQDWITRARTCWDEDTPLPLITQTHTSLSIDEAYEVQAALLKAADLQTYGYKAALTSPAVQRHYGLSAPISGVLINDRGIQNSQQFALVPGLKLETELGFFLAREIKEEVDANNVMDSVSTVAPVIEVARPFLEGPPSAVDLIASNAASYRYIVGDGVTAPVGNIDDVLVELMHNTSSLHAATAGTVMEGQAFALSWLINQLLALGLPLLPGQLLITGAIGDMHDGAVGSYRATYAELGDIHFEISQE